MKTSNLETVAKAIRVEIDENTGEVCLVFKITDSILKKKVREDWLCNLEFIMVGKELIYNIKDD